VDFVKTFRLKFEVKGNIQYLLFGQMIPEEGFNNYTVRTNQENIIKSLKTQNLADYKSKMRSQEDTTRQINKSKYDIE